MPSKSRGAKVEKSCGPDSGEYEHDYLRVEAATRDKGDEMEIRSCRRCGRGDIVIKREKRVGYYIEHYEQIITINLGIRPGGSR
jgi:hypothetical protein